MGEKILFRKDYAFFQVLLGVVLIFIPILLLAFLSTEELNTTSLKIFFTVVGMIGGGAGVYLITNGYYKLTDKFKEFEETDMMEIREEQAAKEARSKEE